MPSKTDDKSGQSKKASSANDNAQSLPVKRKPRRIYKEAVNLNHFGCRGRLITGPDRKYFWMAFGMIIIPAVAFLAAVYVLYANQTHPYEATSSVDSKLIRTVAVGAPKS